MTKSSSQHVAGTSKADDASNVFAGSELFSWASFPHGRAWLAGLASMAQPEPWDFPNSSDQGDYQLLEDYLKYTFYRLHREGKVCESVGDNIAAFNTGLLDRHLDPIYACFYANASGSKRPWCLRQFCTAHDGGSADLLVRAFNPLPRRATYLTRKEDVLFDTSRELVLDHRHMLIENIDRLPQWFLENEFHDHPQALAQVRAAFSARDGAQREDHFKTLGAIVLNDHKLYERIKEELDGAVDRALRRVETCYTLAVPAYYPTADEVSMLLPLDLTEDGAPDIALVTELTPSGNYIGQTIYTLEMAYACVREVTRITDGWIARAMRK